MRGLKSAVVLADAVILLFPKERSCTPRYRLRTLKILGKKYQASFFSHFRTTVLGSTYDVGKC